MKEILKVTFESETQKCVISIQGEGEEMSAAYMQCLTNTEE